MNKGALFGIGAVVVVTALLVLNLRSLVSDMSNKSPKIITASIKLVNKCSMSNDAFVLKDVKTGKSTTFINGIARIDIRKRPPRPCGSDRLFRNVPSMLNVIEN